jgi:hypothetical protein
MKATLQILNGGVLLTEVKRVVIEKEVDELLLGRAFVISDNVIRANK